MTTDRRTRLLALALILLCTNESASAQATLIDVNRVPDASDNDSDPAGFLVIGSGAYFRARNAEQGMELWQTHGIPGASGTTLVADIHPGPGDSDPRHLTEFQGALYFSARDGATGQELWRLPLADGATPQRLTDLFPGTSGSFPRELTVVGATLFFVADDPGVGSELFAIDAAAPTTVRTVSDIDPGSRSGNPYFLTPFGNRLLFSAVVPSRGREPWISDGTNAGTTRLRDVRPLAWGSAPADFVVSGNRAWFAADDGTHGREIWTTDGTTNGTTLWLDVEPGAGDSDPAALLLLPATTPRLGFVAETSRHGREVFVTPTGRPSLTALDVRRGSAGSDPTAPQRFGRELVFAADSGAGGDALYLYDPALGTSRSIDFGVATPLQTLIDDVVVSGAAVYAAGSALFATDGTQAGALRLYRGPPGEIAALPGDRLLFAAEWPEFGIEPHVADLQSQDPLRDVHTETGTLASEPQEFAALPPDVLDGSAAVTGADDGVHGDELVTLVGSTASRTVIDIRPGPGGSDPHRFARTGDEVWFLADDGTHGVELWRTRGDAASTALALDFAPGSADSGIEALFAYRERVCFVVRDAVTGLSLWITDGTASNTARLAQIRAASPSLLGVAVRSVETQNGFLAVIDEQTPTAAEPVTVIESDGTPAGTSLHRGPQLGELDGLGLVDGKLIYTLSFVAVFATMQHTVVAFDPANDSFTQLHQSRFGTEATSRATAGKYFFAGRHPSLGPEPWISRGTTGTTRAIADVAPGAAGSFPDSGGLRVLPAPTAAADGIWWSTLNDGSTARQLWRSDGTSSGTWRVSDPGPTPGSFAIGSLTPVGSGRDLLFAGWGELYTADDTADSARLVQDIWPGLDRSNPKHFTTSGGWVYFSADDGTTGREAWALPLSALGAPNLAIYGSSCSRRAGPLLQADSQPTLGNGSFGIRLGTVQTNQPAALRFGLSASRIPIPGGCTMLTPEVVSIGAFTGTRGSVRVTVPIPNDRNLLGAGLYAQAAFGETRGPLFDSLGLSAGLQMVIGR